MRGTKNQLAENPSAMKRNARPAPIDWVGYGLAILGAVFFSTKAVIIKIAYGEGLSVETLLAARMVVAVPVYLVILFVIIWREPAQRVAFTPRILAGAALVGALGYFVASLLDFAGLQFVSAQYERLVLFTYPFFVFALGAAFFGERLNWRLLPAMVLSYLGITIIFAWNLVAQPEGLVLGTVLILGSALAFALYQLLARRQMRVMGSRVFTCVAMSAAGFFAISYASIMDGPLWFAQISGRGWVEALALGTVGTVIPSFMLNGAIGRIGPRATASMGNFGPITTIIMAVVILSEPFTLVHAAGTACVIAGALWFGRQQVRGPDRGAARVVQAERV